MNTWTTDDGAVWLADTDERLTVAAAPIDPLSLQRPGRYADHLVRVVRERSDEQPPGAPGEIVRTAHFHVRRRGHRLELGHWLTSDQLDNDLAGLLAEELFAPGWLSGADVFERVFTGVVRSCVNGHLRSWGTFYDNTLARIRRCWDSAEPADHSSIAGFAPVYRRALELTPPGEVLDLGSCFGFLVMLLAGQPGYQVTASDVAGGTMGLLGAMAGARRLPVTTLTCDAARVPRPDRSVDTVTVIHLLEHVDARHGDAVLREALRLARRRVVVAVPYEEEPTAAYGHVRCFGSAELRELGHRTGHPFTVTEFHGGWLVIETS